MNTICDSWGFDVNYGSFDTIETTEVSGVTIRRIKRHEDERGYFQEIFNNNSYFEIKQVNVSVSKKNVVRGLHVAPYAKLCTCISGCLYDVVVDLRKDSPTYKKWCGVWLDSRCPRRIYVPAGCGHGFFSSEDNTTMLYFQDGLYDPEKEYGVFWKDPSLNIKWAEAKEYILSEKDQNAPCLREDV